MSTKKEPKDWITVNGKHVPIFEGESKQDAVNRAIAKDNEDKKNSDIAKAQAERDKLNGKTKSDKEKKLAELQEKLDNAKGLFAKSAIKTEMDMVRDDWKGTKDEYLAHQKEQHDKAVQESIARKQAEIKAKQEAEEAKKKNLEHELKTQPKDKVEQFKIIQKHNPMQDDYHQGIRKPSDIKTWEEAVKSASDDDAFSWGDFSKKDAEKALKSGKITIYSSYPIGQGVFVSTSKSQSEQYAGGKGKKVYSKVVPLSEVAWINGDEGQYAVIRRK